MTTNGLSYSLPQVSHRAMAPLLSMPIDDRARHGGRGVVEVRAVRLRFVVVFATMHTAWIARADRAMLVVGRIGVLRVGRLGLPLPARRRAGRGGGVVVGFGAGGVDVLIA